MVLEVLLSIDDISKVFCILMALKRFLALEISLTVFCLQKTYSRTSVFERLLQKHTLYRIPLIGFMLFFSPWKAFKSYFVCRDRKKGRIPMQPLKRPAMY